MSDAGDIRELLAGWPFDPENDARIVRGKDGRDYWRNAAGFVGFQPSVPESTFSMVMALASASVN